MVRVGTSEGAAGRLGPRVDHGRLEGRLRGREQSSLPLGGFAWRGEAIFCYRLIMLRMDVKALDQFLDEAFPQARTFGFEIDELDEEHIRLRLPTSKQHLRPGGTVNGPALMTMADSATYLLVLARLGPVALAVTTSLNINFMRKPKPGVLVADARLLKLGKRIVVTEVRLTDGEDDADLYAHATVTYSIPPER